MGDVARSVGNAIGSIGGETNGIAQGFTPQNEFQGTDPMNQAELARAISLSHANFAGAQNNENNLAAALMAQQNGQGPNPAQAMLNQATNKNIAQNTGMIASQKGISPALAARLSSENAANMNQQAAGQGAVMNAQQRLANQAQLGGLYGQIANQNVANINTSGTLANQGSLGAQGLNAGVAAQNAAATQATNAGLLSGLGNAAMAAAMSHGGVVPHYAAGGFSIDPSSSAKIAQQIMGQSGMPMWAQGATMQSSSPVDKIKGSPGEIPGSDGSSMMTAGGGDALGGGADLAVMAAAHGALIAGGNVPGTAQVAGDSPKNDTVPAMLSPGEIVIPRSKVDDPEKAKKFIEHLKKQKAKKTDGGGYGKVLEAHRKLGEALKAVGAK